MSPYRKPPSWRTKARAHLERWLITRAMLAGELDELPTGTVEYAAAHAMWMMADGAVADFEDVLDER